MNRLKYCVAAILLASLALAGVQGKEPTYLTVRQTGFAFQYPPNWKLVLNKREQMLVLPTAAKHEASQWHFYPVDFRKTISAWQETQVVVAQEFNRVVERQWQEDILGVPLLLTKTTSIDKRGVPDVVLTGLLYSQSPNKVLFRVTCAAEDFDEADALWRKAFQSLRTVDGSEPKADDPNKKFSKEDYEAKPNGPLPVTSVGIATASGHFQEGPVMIPAKAGGKDATIRLPKDWTFKPQKDGSWLVTVPGLSSPLTMNLASTLDSDPIMTALNKQAGATLDSFTAVSDRTDVTNKVNKAGATLNAVWRTGTTSTGKLTTFDAVVNNSDLYALFHFQVASAVSGEDRRLLDELANGTTIDFKP